MKPSSSITISFDFTVKILTSFTFRLLSYPYSKGGFHFTCKGKDFLAYFTTTKVKCSNILAGIALGLTGVEVRRQLKAKLRNSAIALPKPIHLNCCRNTLLLYPYRSQVSGFFSAALLA